MRKLLPLLLLLAAVAACAGTGSEAGAPAPAAQTQLPHDPTSVLVMLEDPDDDEEIEEIREDFAGIDITRLGQSSFFRIDVPLGIDLLTLLDSLDHDIRIVDSELNYLGRVPEGGPSGGTVFGDDLQASVATQNALTTIRVPAAHAVARGAGIMVAVVDTGVDATHPLLAPHVLLGAGFDFFDQDGDASEDRNFADDDGDGLIDEQFGHGTFIASLVLAVAPHATIVPVRVLNDDGVGTASTIAAGIVWAADAGSHVINVSVALPDAADAVKHAIDYARNRGAVVIAAAGNDGRDDVIFPARFGDVLAVTASDNNGIVPIFANHGSKVSVVAPGVELIGAYPEAFSQRGTARWTGTSFSTPLVSGTAALIFSAFPGIDPDEVLDRVVDTAMSLDAQNPGLSGRLGTGLINAAAAVR